MNQHTAVECPLCFSQAELNQIDLSRMRFRCARCTEFVLWRSAETRLKNSAEQTLLALSVAAQSTTDPAYVYVIRGQNETALPHIDLQGQPILRSKALT